MANYNGKDWVYRFIKQFEYMVGTYMLPIGLVLSGTEAVMTGKWDMYKLYAAVFIFELAMWLMKEAKGDLKKSKIWSFEWQYLLFQCYSLVSPLIVLQLFSFSSTALYLLIIPIGCWSKFLLFKRLKDPLE
jgi:hypothetical protein